MKSVESIYVDLGEFAALFASGAWVRKAFHFAVETFRGSSTYFPPLDPRQKIGSIPHSPPVSTGGF